MPEGGYRWRSVDRIRRYSSPGHGEEILEKRSSLEPGYRRMPSTPRAEVDMLLIPTRNMVWLFTAFLVMASVFHADASHFGVEITGRFRNADRQCMAVDWAAQQRGTNSLDVGGAAVRSHGENATGAARRPAALQKSVAQRQA